MKPDARACIRLASLLASLTTLHAFSDAVLPGTSQYWGAETNGVKAGLCFRLAPDPTNQVQVFFIPTLNNSQTTQRRTVASCSLM